MFKHNWAWIKLATYNSSTVLTRNLRNPRDYAPLKVTESGFLRMNPIYAAVSNMSGVNKSLKSLLSRRSSKTAVSAI